MTDETVNNGTDEGQSNSQSKSDRQARADARTKRARRLIATIVAILLLLLAAVTALFIRAIAPMGAPDKKADLNGIEWVRSIYGYGKAQEDQLSGPNDVAIDRNGTIWVSDTSHARVIGFAPDGSYRAMIHQGPAFSSPKALQTPIGVAVDEANKVWVTDYGRQKVSQFTSRNVREREWDAPLPTSIYVRDHRVIVGSYSGVAIANEAGELIRGIGTHGSAPDQFDIVQGVVIAKDGTIYATDTHNNRLRAFTRDGKLLWSKQLGAPSAGSLSKPNKTNTNDKNLVELPTGLTLDGAGRLVFVDPFEFAIVVADPKDGKVIAKYGTSGTADGKFAYPTGIDYDPQRDWFAVADTANNRVQIVRIPGSGGSGLDALRRMTTGWWKICGIPLLLILIALIATWLMRRKARKQAQKTTEAGEGDQVGDEATDAVAGTSDNGQGASAGDVDQA